MFKKIIFPFLLAILVLLLAAAILFIFTAHTQTSTKSESSQVPEYETTLFQSDRVHTLDIQISEDNWEYLLANAVDKEYVPCDVVIDGTAFESVGLRAKGNSSLSEVVSMGSMRYSFKLEFDHYKDGESCWGLDKLSLNNIIQDNTYMKDFLSYTLMNDMGAFAPLCSYIYITVNGEDFGLYLAVEGIEDSFLDRTFDTDTGSLYKPETSDGVLKNGNALLPKEDPSETISDLAEVTTAPFDEVLPEHTIVGLQEESNDLSNSSADDVALKYLGDEIIRYPHIFDEAVTDVDEEDKLRLIDAIRKMNAEEDLDQVLNTDEILRYFVVHNFVCNFDSYTGPMLHNYYLYEDKGQLAMIAWDYNLAFGGFSIGELMQPGKLRGETENTAELYINYPMDTPVDGTMLEDRPLLYVLLSNDAYLEQYHELFDEFLSNYFENGSVSSLIESTKEMIEPYVEQDPTSFCTVDEFSLGADSLITFCELRAQSLRGQLDGSIPSTLAGQTDSTAFVSSGDLVLSSLGGAKIQSSIYQRPHK